MQPPGRPNMTSTFSISRARMSACAPVIFSPCFDLSLELMVFSVGWFLGNKKASRLGGLGARRRMPTRLMNYYDDNCERGCLCGIHVLQCVREIPVRQPINQGEPGVACTTTRRSRADGLSPSRSWRWTWADTSATAVCGRMTRPGTREPRKAHTDLARLKLNWLTNRGSPD